MKETLIRNSKLDTKKSQVLIHPVRGRACAHQTESHMIVIFIALTYRLSKLTRTENATQRVDLRRAPSYDNLLILQTEL